MLVDLDDETNDRLVVGKKLRIRNQMGTLLTVKSGSMVNQRKMSNVYKYFARIHFG